MSISNTVFRCSFLRYNILLCTACHISSRKIMSILCFVMFLLWVEIYFHISNELVIALWPCTTLANIFIVSDILLLFHSSEGSWNKSQKFKKLGKCLPYCSQRRAITSTLFFFQIINDINIVNVQNICNLIVREEYSIGCIVLLVSVRCTVWQKTTTTFDISDEKKITYWEYVSH